MKPDVQVVLSSSKEVAAQFWRKWWMALLGLLAFGLSPHMSEAPWYGRLVMWFVRNREAAVSQLGLWLLAALAVIPFLLVVEECARRRGGFNGGHLVDSTRWVVTGLLVPAMVGLVAFACGAFVTFGFRGVAAAAAYALTFFVVFSVVQAFAGFARMRRRT